MLFCEGFGHGLMDAFNGYWSTPNVGAFVLSSSVKHQDVLGNGSGYSLRTAGFFDVSTTHAFGDGDMWVHVAMKCDSNSYSILKFLRNGENQASITVDSGIINLRLGNFDGTILASSLPVIVSNTWHYYWIKLDAQSSGSMEVYVNGNTTPAVTFSGDCQNATLTGWDQFSFRGGFVVNVYWADVVTFSSAEKTAEFGTTYPELFIPAIIPTSDDVNDFTGGYAEVDEIPWSSAEYATSTVIGDELIMNNTGLGWTPSSVHGVAITTYLTRSGSIYSFQPRLKSGLADFTGATFSPMAGGQYVQRQEMVQLNPDGSAQWTYSDVTSCKFGVKTV